MDFIVGFLLTIIDILVWIIVIGVIMSWLIVLNVVNLSNQYVRLAYDLLNRITEPLLNPIRRLLPDLGGIDISPLVLILLLMFVKYLLLADPAQAVVLLIATLFTVAITILIICAVLTWMTAFGAINMSNRFVYMIYDSLTRICDPFLNPIRRFVPRIGGIDISFIVLIVVLYLLRYLIKSAI